MGRRNERQEHIAQRKYYEVQSDELQNIRHREMIRGARPPLGKAEQENARDSSRTKKQKQSELDRKEGRVRWSKTGRSKGKVRIDPCVVHHTVYEYEKGKYRCRDQTANDKRRDRPEFARERDDFFG